MTNGYEDYLNNEIQRHNAWGDVEHSERVFDQCQDKIKVMKCSVHKRRGYAEWEYEEDYTTHVTIRKACCMVFAKEIGRVFFDAKVFDSISVNEGGIKFPE